MAACVSQAGGHWLRGVGQTGRQVSVPLFGSVTADCLVGVSRLGVLLLDGGAAVFGQRIVLAGLPVAARRAWSEVPVIATVIAVTM